MTDKETVPAAKEGTPPDSRTGSTEDTKEVPTMESAPLIDRLGPEQYTAYMSQALSTDFWGQKPVEMSNPDLYALIGALNADRLALANELDQTIKALQELQNEPA